MRLDDLDPSKNVRDQGRGGGGSFGGGSGGGGLGLLLGFLPMLLGRKMGCGTILLIGGAALAFMYFSSCSSLMELAGAVSSRKAPALMSPAIQQKKDSPVRCSPRPSRLGPNYFRRMAKPIVRPPSLSMTSPVNQAAAQHKRRWDPFIARRIRASISTPASSAKWRPGWARRAILRKPM